MKIIEKISTFDECQDQVVENQPQPQIDHTQSKIYLEKSQLQYKNFNDLIKALKGQLLSTCKPNNITEHKIFVKPDIIHLVDAIINKCVLAKIIHPLNEFKSQVYIEDPETFIMRLDKDYLETIFSELCDLSTEDKVVVSIKDISYATLKVVEHLRSRLNIRLLQEMPSNYIVTNNNEIIDLISKRRLDINEFRLHYDITSVLNVNFINYSNQTKEQKLKSTLHRQIINRIMEDWSGGIQDKQKLLWQISYAVVQNDNHDKFFIIIGGGGNGKSAFTTILSKLAGHKNVVYANIHQFNDPNAINEIGPHTRVVIGDDAATNHKVNDVALSNLKTLTTHQTLSVAVKYEKNKLIRTKAVIIQCTNTDLNFYESNSALTSRAVVFEWTNEDFRSKKSELTFDLDELIKDQSFIDEFFMMCIEKVEDFKQFTIPESVKDATINMIESNDSIEDFLNEIIDDINGYREVPISVLYQSYIDWFKLINPKGIPMKLQTFTKHLKSKETKFGFNVSDQRKRFATHQNKNSFIDLFKLEFNQEILKLMQTYIAFDNCITQQEIDDFLNKQHPVDNLSTRDVQIIRQACYDQQNRFLKAIYEI